MRPIRCHFLERLRPAILPRAEFGLGGPLLDFLPLWVVIVDLTCSRPAHHTPQPTAYCSPKLLSPLDELLSLSQHSRTTFSYVHIKRSYFFSRPAVLSSQDSSRLQPRSSAASSSLALQPTPNAVQSPQTAIPKSGQEEVTRKKPQSSQASPSYNNPDTEPPPPPYTESSSPIPSFTFCMAAAGGSASIITQVQQGGPPLSNLGGTVTCFPSRESQKSSY